MRYSYNTVVWGRGKESVLKLTKRIRGFWAKNFFCLSHSLSSVLLFRVVKFYGGWKRKRSFWGCLCHLFFLSFFLFLKTPLPAPRARASLKRIYIINERLHSVLKLDYRWFLLWLLWLLLLLSQNASGEERRLLCLEEKAESSNAVKIETSSPIISSIPKTEGTRTTTVRLLKTTTRNWWWCKQLPWHLFWSFLRKRSPLAPSTRSRTRSVRQSFTSCPCIRWKR